MQYDASPAALFHPERQPSLPMDATWSADAIAAEMARLAYFRIEDDDVAFTDVKTALARVGYRGLTQLAAEHRASFLRILDPRGFAAVSSAGQAVIAFRGTRPDYAVDGISDIIVPLFPWEGAGRVHFGFRQSLRMILPAVQTWLAAVKPTKLSITGHSLGGALATLLAGLHPEAD